MKSIAVIEVMRARSVGRALVEEALAVATSDGAERMLVATAAADIGNLRLGYPDQTLIDGIPLRDRIWFDQSLV